MRDGVEALEGWRVRRLRGGLNRLLRGGLNRRSRDGLRGGLNRRLRDGVEALEGRRMRRSSVFAFEMWSGSDEASGGPALVISEVVCWVEIGSLEARGLDVLG